MASAAGASPGRAHARHRAPEAEAGAVPAARDGDTGPRALAFSNNDIAVLAWTFGRKLDGCLGFAISRIDLGSGREAVLPALARFADTPADAAHTTEQAPVQKFWWKDLGARRGSHVRYRIVPMTGRPGALTPLPGVAPLVTNPVALTHDRGLFQSYFNRGLVASQAVLRELGTPSAARLLRRIERPEDPLRRSLSGELMGALTSLLDEADADGGEIRAALYELDDPNGLEIRLQAHDRGDPASRAVVLGNARESAGTGAGRVVTADADARNRQNLKDAGVSVTDRILPSGHIPHNKFLVLKKQGQPVAVLTGSTNWTKTGLSTQTNNALLIRSPRVAARYQAYWDQLERDTGAASLGGGHWQSAALRDWTRAHSEAVIADPIELEDGSARVEVHFSPNTRAALKSPPRETPVDMARVFEIVGRAKSAVLFLAFDPGNNSILDAAGQALAANPALFVRGALTSAERAGNFREAVETAKRAGGGDPADMTVATVGEPAHGSGSDEPDFRAIPAGAVTEDDRFGAWEAELRGVGHAIIHDKIVVVDPFADDCVVILGSHNLGYRASHNNDENMVVVTGHRPLAEAYACHVLDVYDHYAWRYWLAKDPATFGRPLRPDADWQDRYIRGGREVSAEMRFWLSARPVSSG